MSDATTPETPDEQVEGQLTLDGPDPGNAEPDAWSRPLTDEEADDAYGAINEVVVNLPEPDTTDGGAG
jgi:hypothetical protein